MTDTVIQCSYHNYWRIYNRQDCRSPLLEQAKKFTIIYIYHRVPRP